MFRGFNLKVDPGSFKGSLAAGKSVLEKNEVLARESVDSILAGKGGLDAEKIMAEWFPQVGAHVFISHSHQDSEDAQGLAGWLKNRFNLDAFVDAAVWGYADNLLKQLDNKYCLKDDKKTYDYGRRNRSTAHVHMMLTSALMRLINATECIFFLNTPNSTNETEHLGASATLSPWLYSELMISSLIQRRPISDHRGKDHLVKGYTLDSAAMESLDIKYKFDTSHMTALTLQQMKDWDDNVAVRPKDGASALDVLYKLHPLQHKQ